MLARLMLRHKLRLRVLLVTACAIGLSGCALLDSLLAPSNRPTATLVGVRITDFSLSDLTVVLDVAVKNPYGVALPLANIDYAFASQGQPFLKGQAPLQGSIPAGQSKTFALPTKVVFAELLKLLTSVRPGAIIPYRATLGLSVNAPVLGPLRLPLEKDGTLPVPAPPSVSVASVGWTNVSLAGASGVLKLRVANPNAFAFDVAGLDYDIKLGSFPLAKGGLVNAANLAPGAAQELGIKVAVSTAQAGMAIIQLVQGRSSAYSLGGALSIGTPFGPLRLPVSVSGQVPFVR
jgi:LEA14-like dessication related protein